MLNNSWWPAARFGIALLASLAAAEETLPRVATRANAKLEDAQVFTVAGIGAGQGVSMHEGRLYFYGDVGGDERRAGLIREFTLELKPTGRDIELSRDGKPLITHPTGLTWHEEWGCFLGDTVDGAANIYRINWPQALDDGNLNGALLSHIRDDAAVNGCRPEFVTLNGKAFLATADYGDQTPAIRLYDVARMLKAKRTSTSGTVVHRIKCGPFNQNLHWDERTGEITSVQNLVAGVGWRLARFDLAAAVERGDATHEDARAERLTFSRASELEGYRPLPEVWSVFVTASETENVLLGRVERIPQE